MLSSESEDTNKDHYEEVSKYYSSIPATIDGMLNGYSDISDLDIQTSKEFLLNLYNKKKLAPGKTRVLDVGAGIGRISKNLLSKHFEKVDLLEQSTTFIEQAKESLKDCPNVDRWYNVGLQDFKPEDFSVKYDVIWIQWVLMFVLDEDIIKFINVCKQILTENGVIVVKDNVASGIKNEFDEEDSSVVRSLSHYCLLFSKANLKCIKSEKVNGLPKPLFKVYMFALKPNKEKESSES
uniref:Alpha N-terminal protein methyltransferase 1 n=2 Tax=Cacopsylla melanoneura TaxID=428564 RepID=A0A8D8YCM0_9HEMI